MRKTWPLFLLLLGLSAPVIAQEDEFEDEEFDSMDTVPPPPASPSGYDGGSNYSSPSAPPPPMEGDEELDEGAYEDDY